MKDTKLSVIDNTLVGLKKDLECMVDMINRMRVENDAELTPDLIRCRHLVVHSEEVLTKCQFLEALGKAYTEEKKETEE